MKKIKLLFAVITVLTLLFTVSFANADSIVRFDGAVYDDATQTVTVSVYGNKDVTIANGGYIVIEYDSTIWEIDEYPAGTDVIFGEEFGGPGADPWDDGMFTITPDYDASHALTKDVKICDITFRYTGSGEPVGSVFSFVESDSDMYDGSMANVVCAGSIAVTGGAPVGPVSVATTMTIGEKEYTSVPNALVENVNFTDGVITGALNIDYWKNGEKVNTPVVIEATKFAGMPANVTGTGTASFTVALMGVPSNVVVTGISFK